MASMVSSSPVVSVVTMAMATFSVIPMGSIRMAFIAMSVISMTTVPVIAVPVIAVPVIAVPVIAVSMISMSMITISMEVHAFIFLEDRLELIDVLLPVVVVPNEQGLQHELVKVVERSRFHDVEFPGVLEHFGLELFRDVSLQNRILVLFRLFADAQFGHQVVDWRAEDQADDDSQLHDEQRKNGLVDLVVRSVDARNALRHDDVREDVRQRSLDHAAGDQVHPLFPSDAHLRAS